MTRNIDYRIEVATPILDPRLKQRVLDIIDILFSDTVKRVLSIRTQQPLRTARQSP